MASRHFIGCVIGVLTAFFLTSSIGASANRLRDSPATSARAFFDTEVVPRLAENGCPTCHASGYVEPSFSYAGYLPLLGMGRSDSDNYLINKISKVAKDGRSIHVGGRRCSRLDDEPCKSLRAWWRIEFQSALRR